MNFNEFKQSLKYKKYKIWKIIVRYLEYKSKDLLISIIISFNKFKFNSKKIINLGNFKDNSYINFLNYSLKNDYCFSYNENKDAIKLFKRIGFINFFKNTVSNSYLKESENIKLNMHFEDINKNEIFIDTNYYDYLSDKEKLEQNSEVIMPYFMYPRIYNNFYKNINIIKKPNLDFRIFFSGSIVEEGYKSFTWEENEKKFPNRVEIINEILKEYKNEIFLIKSKKDLKSNQIFRKKIILCLHEKMIKKSSYILNFKDNFDLLSSSCFNLNCPGVVMPLCHHLVEGMKVGSIPITNCKNFVYPNLTEKNSLNYSSIEELNNKIQQALYMPKDKILFMRSNVLNYYKSYLSPESFTIKFRKILEKNKKKIIFCDDHRSVNQIK